MCLLLEFKADNHMDCSKSMRMYCVGVEARTRLGGRPAVAEAERTGDADDELTEWQGVFLSDLLYIYRELLSPRPRDRQPIHLSIDLSIRSTY